MGIKFKSSRSYLLNALFAAVFCAAILFYHVTNPKVTKVGTYEDFEVNTWTERVDDYNDHDSYTKYMISVDCTFYEDFEPDFTAEDKDVYTAYEEQKNQAKKTERLFKGSVTEHVFAQFEYYSKRKLTLYKTSQGEVFPVYSPECDAKEASREYRQMHPTYLWLCAVIFLAVYIVLHISFGLAALRYEHKMRSI